MLGMGIDHLISSSKSFPNNLSHCPSPVSGLPQILRWSVGQNQAEQRHEAHSGALSKKAAHRIKLTGVQSSSSYWSFNSCHQ
jgi:hypothetical protein